MKRKLKDLKENECIKVNTLAQAKYFIEKLGFNKTTPQNLVGKYIVKDGDYFVWIEANLDTVYDASDFIKLKSSGMKKAVKELRETCKELAETQQKTNEYLEVLNGRPQATIEYTFVDKNEPIGNSEQLAVVSKMENTELEVGKWYKANPLWFPKENVVSSMPICISEINKDYCLVYGFNGKGDWFDLTKFAFEPIERRYMLATPEEVESALIKEAERRGFKEGVLVKSLNFDAPTTDRHNNCNLSGRIHCYNHPTYGFIIDGHTKEDDWEFSVSNPCIFYNGKWAETISEEQTIDWSKPGQLVVDEYGGVVMVSESFISTFKGIVVKQCKAGAPVGVYSDFTKSHFKPYKGTITLKND